MGSVAGNPVDPSGMPFWEFPNKADLDRMPGSWPGHADDVGGTRPGMRATPLLPARTRTQR